MLINVGLLVAIARFAITAPNPFAACPQPPMAGPVTTIATFPQGSWVENLAVRSDNSVLTTLFEPAQIILVSPLEGDEQRLKIVHTFANPKIGVLGIVELEHDIFYFETVTRGAELLTPLPGTGQIWRLDLRTYNGSEVTPTPVFNLTESIFPNGATLVPGTHLMLIGDGQGGIVWRVDLDDATGRYDIAANNSALKPTAAFDLGVNGVHARAGYLYFTNSAQGLYARFPIDQRGVQTGDVEILTTGLDGLVDDFDFGTSRRPSTAAIAAMGSANEVVFTPGDQGACATSVLAKIEGPTAIKVHPAHSQRRSVTVFVTSAGNESAYEGNGTATTSGALSSFQLYYPD